MTTAPAGSHTTIIQHGSSSTWKTLWHHFMTEPGKATISFMGGLYWLYRKDLTIVVFFVSEPFLILMNWKCISSKLIYVWLKVSWASNRTKSLQTFSLLAHTLCLNCTFSRWDYIRMSSKPKRKDILPSTWKDFQNYLFSSLVLVRWHYSVTRILKEQAPVYGKA